MQNLTNTPHQRLQRRGVALAACGAALGVFLFALGLFPLFKVYTGEGDFVVFLLLCLSLFLRRCAMKERGLVLSAILWLACGITSVWTVLQFSIQNSMQ